MAETQGHAATSRHEHGYAALTFDVAGLQTHGSRMDGSNPHVDIAARSPAMPSP